MRGFYAHHSDCSLARAIRKLADELSQKPETIETTTVATILRKLLVVEAPDLRACSTRTLGGALKHGWTSMQHLRRIER